MIWFPFSVVTCQAQEAPEHGSLVCNDPLGKFSYNSSCSVSCGEGYLPSSPEATQCTSSGEWSVPLPACNGKSLSEGTEHSLTHPSLPYFLSSLYHFQHVRDSSFKLVLIKQVLIKLVLLANIYGQYGTSWL